MITPEVALTFFVVYLSLCLIPGPEMVLVLSQSSLCGRSAGIAITLGVCTALVIHVIAMAFGLTVIFQSSELAFNVLKVVGVSYLLFLAWQTLKQPVSTQLRDECSSEKSQKSVHSFSALYRRGLFVTGSNAITPIFMLIFLPPFVESGGSQIFMQLLQLGALMVFATFLLYTTFSLLSDMLGKKAFRFEKTNRYIKYGVSTILFIFAVFLAFSSQNLT